MSKTPITVLQEFTTKLGELPHYSEISTVNINGKNEFTIGVKWKNYCNKGIGTSKKEAKQNAAKEMLLFLISLKEIPQHILSSIPTTEWSNIIVPPTNTGVDQVMDVSVPTTNLDTSNGSSISNVHICSSKQKQFTNYVGYLQEYCKANYIPDPCYGLVATTGPSHCTVFTMSCSVASTRREASGNTKKIAKQEAAKQVFEYVTKNYNKNTRLKTIIDELNVELKEEKVDQVISSKTEKAIEVYRNLKCVPITLEKKSEVKDYHNILTNFFCNISQVQKDTLTDIYKMIGYYSSDLNNLKSIIYNTLKIPLKRITFTTNKENLYMIGFGLHTAPMIFQIGTGPTAEEAEKRTLCKLFEHIFLYFK